MYDNGIWDMVSSPTEKKAIGCKWVFVIKVNSDGTVARLKFHLVAKGYDKSMGLIIFYTFSHAKLTFI